MSPAQLASLVLLIPLVSAAVIALFLRRRGALASYVSVAAAAGIAVVSSLLIFGGHRDFPASVEWLRIGTFAISFGVKFDDLAALMLFVVSFVGFWIHVFSLGYMRDDPAKARFFGGLCRYTGSEFSGDAHSRDIGLNRWFPLYAGRCERNGQCNATEF